MKLLKKLTAISAPSGHEENIREFIIDYAKGKCSEAHTDAIGNLTLIKRGGGKKKIMLAAHMDEIGVISKFIDDKGFIRFEALGGLEIRNLVHRRVCFMNGVCGVIGSEEEAFNEKPRIDKLFIDIGVSSKKEAMEKISIGDMAVFCGEMTVNGDIVVSKALDNRVGCYVLLKTMDKIKTDSDVYFTFTAQEEVGLRGAGPAAYAINPDYSITVDVTDTGDTPSSSLMDVKLGGGAAVKIMDHSILCDAYLRSFMMEVARKHKIPYQAEIMTDGGTDAGRIHLIGNGIKSGGISIPTRYIHSPSEQANISDINNCIKLLAVVVNEL